MRIHREILELLPQYCEALLPEARARFVAEHLQQCDMCRKACDEIRASVAALRTLPPQRLSEEASHRMLSSLRNASSARRNRSHAVAWLAVAAALVLLLSGALLFRMRTGIDMRLESGKPPELETLALQLHQQRMNGSLQLGLRTTSPAEARSWMAQNGGPVAKIALQRPPEDGDAYRLEGIDRIQYHGRWVLLVAYRVENHPVTLVTANSSEFPDHPPEGLLSKRIFYHTDASGMKTITWAISGQVYTLVSDLPGYGEQGCFVCHTEASRRSAIRSLASQVRK